jgi:hypothetical protein
MSRRLSVSSRTWPLKEPFAISRGVETECDAIVVGLADGDVEGVGEAIGVSYHDETVASMTRQIEDARAAIEAGASREQLLDLLPAGGARNAVDGALWDLEAKKSGVRAWERAGVGKGGSIVTAVTIGIRSLDAYAASARALADHPWIKIKVGSDDPIAAIETVRRAAPRSKLVVDPNQAWSVAELADHMPRLLELGVDLLEQPVDVEADVPSPAARCRPRAWRYLVAPAAAHQFREQCRVGADVLQPLGQLVADRRRNPIRCRHGHSPPPWRYARYGRRPGSASRAAPDGPSHASSAALAFSGWPI